MTTPNLIFVLLGILYVGVIGLLVKQNRMLKQQEELKEWTANQFERICALTGHIADVQAEESTLTCYECKYHKAELDVDTNVFVSGIDSCDVVLRHYCARYGKDCRDRITATSQNSRRSIECIQDNSYTKDQ